MNTEPWVRADSDAQSLTDDANAIGWENEETGEYVARTTLDDGEFVVYHYGDTYGSDRLRGVNRSTLFRSDSADVSDRVEPHLAESGEYLDTSAVQQVEIDDPRTLGEWANVNGADYYMTEKIGNRKESGGNVAVFEGSTRRGEGAYVAIASEDGPRGHDYVSVGTKPNGHYRVETEGFSKPNRGAIELEWPTVSFTRDSVIVKSGEKQMVITVE